MGTATTESAIGSKRITKIVVACLHERLEQPMNQLQRGDFLFLGDEFWFALSSTARTLSGDKRLTTVGWKFTDSDGPGSHEQVILSEPRASIGLCLPAASRHDSISSAGTSLVQTSRQNANDWMHVQTLAFRRTTTLATGDSRDFSPGAKRVQTAASPARCRRAHFHLPKR